MINSVLIYPGARARVSEAQIQKVESALDGYGIKHGRVPDFPAGAQAVIALGGDGTMLDAAKIAVERGLPLLGINFGTLGYMTGLESGELELLAGLKAGPQTEKRMLIDIAVERAGAVEANFTALNEAVLIRRPESGLAKFELKCDGSTVCAYRADGLIVATPTGSSGYSMSAGGPIIDTKLDAFCVCPICPHALGSRAMVFSPNSLLSVKNLGRDGEVTLTADGRALAGLECGDSVVLKRSARVLELIKLKKDAFYDVLYKKMN